MKSVWLFFDDLSGFDAPEIKDAFNTIPVPIWSDREYIPAVAHTERIDPIFDYRDWIENHSHPSKIENVSNFITQILEEHYQLDSDLISQYIKYIKPSIHALNGENAGTNSLVNLISLRIEINNMPVPPTYKEEEKFTQIYEGYFNHLVKDLNNIFPLDIEIQQQISADVIEALFSVYIHDISSGDGGIRVQIIES